MRRQRFVVFTRNPAQCLMNIFWNFKCRSLFNSLSQRLGRHLLLQLLHLWHPIYHTQMCLMAEKNSKLSNSYNTETEVWASPPLLCFINIGTKPVCPGGAASLPASSPTPSHTPPVALEKVGASFSFANDLGSGYNGPLRCFVEEKRKMELSGGGIKRLEWGPGTPGRKGLESDPDFSEKRGQEGPCKGPESS